ncbi:MAG: S53 family peptidase [Terriglobales bacterium]
MARLPKCVSVVLFLLIALVAFAQSAPQNRIVQAIDNAQFTAIRGSAHPMAKPEFDRGPVDGSMQLHGISMVFKPSPSQQQALDTLLAEQQDSTSPNYHKWLTPEQYADRFSMTRNDIEKISAWLQSQGFTVDSTPGSRTRILFSGTAAQIESAFHSPIHQYEVNGEKHFANAGALSVPVAFAQAVLGFRGLNDFRPKPRLITRRKAAVSPHYTVSQGENFLAPEDFATIYDVQRLYDIGIDGTGQTIAVMGQTAIKMSDVTSFRSAAGLSTNNPTIVTVPGTGTPVITSADDLGEADLDLEWSGAVAKNATILFVTVGSTSGNVFDSFFYALDPSTNNVVLPPLAPVISISYGACEAANGIAFAQDVQQAVQMANSEGTTVTAAAGDSGAADCDDNGTASATQGLAVDVPGAVPEVTAVGGSEFLADVSNPNAYWSAVTDANGGSALMYIGEEVWNDTSEQGALDAGGGGVSTFFSLPSWQTGVTGVLSSGRNVPDISLNASNNHDPYLFCSTPIGSATACTDGFISANSELYLVGGTSAGAPTFAGILALINQATNSASGQGNVNLTLYPLAKNTPATFHDITTGNNIVPCTKNTTGCPASSPFQYGYSAAVGYDQASGLGTPEVYNLVTNWPGYSTTPTYTVGGTTVSIASAGGAGSSTITVDALNGFNGTVNLTCTPPSSATALITCSIPASVTVNGTNTTTTLTVNTTAAHFVPGTFSAANRGMGWFAASGGGLFAGVLVMGVPSRRRKYTAMFGMVLLAFAVTGVACGGGSSSTGPTNPGTPAGNYTVVVSAVSGSISRTLNVSVTVK